MTYTQFSRIMIWSLAGNDPRGDGRTEMARKHQAPKIHFNDALDAMRAQFGAIITLRTAANSAVRILKDDISADAYKRAAETTDQLRKMALIRLEEALAEWDALQPTNE